MGTLEQLHKCRGEKKALEKIYECMKARNFHGGKVRISHSYNENAAKELAAYILADYPECDILIYPNTGLCCFYAEEGGFLIGFES